MPAILTELIDKSDVSEVVRDELAAILVLEVAEQQRLATDAGKDPNFWKLRVFSERANPWEQFLDAPDQAAGVPIVNVALDNVNYDESSSNHVKRQKASAAYSVDCYGYGISADDGAGGHVTGDSKAALEAQRAVRLVRNILMAGAYTYLGLRKTVWRRWIDSIQFYQPAQENAQVQQIVAARIQFRVEFSEFSPQVQPETLELVSGEVFRAENDEILLTAEYPATPSP